MKHQRRIGAALAVCLLCMAVLIPCADAEMVITPRASTLIQYTGVGISNLGGGEVEATAIIQCVMSVTTLGFNYVRIQEYRDGAWTTVRSTYSQYAGNKSRHSYTLTYNGTTGMRYRAQAGFVAQNGSVTDTTSRSSGEITAN